MKTIKLEEYQEPYICAVGETIEYIPSDNLEYIKKYKEKGYTIYGVVSQEIFDETFIERDIQYTFERYADDNGYEDMSEYINFDSEAFIKIKEAVRNFIIRLGDNNLKFFLDKKTIVEVD